MPPITRKGDLNTGHDSFPPVPLKTGSDNVFVNGVPCGRKNDSYEEHSYKNSTHSGTISEGSPTVFVNGIPIARVGDSVSCGGAVAEGSPNVFAN